MATWGLRSKHAVVSEKIKTLMPLPDKEVSMPPQRDNNTTAVMRERFQNCTRLYDNLLVRMCKKENALTNAIAPKIIIKVTCTQGDGKSVGQNTTLRSPNKSIPTSAHMPGGAASANTRQSTMARPRAVNRIFIVAVVMPTLCKMMPKERPRGAGACRIDVSTGNVTAEPPSGLDPASSEANTAVMAMRQWDKSRVNPMTS